MGELVLYVFGNGWHRCTMRSQEVADRAGKLADGWAKTRAVHTVHDLDVVIAR